MPEHPPPPLLSPNLVCAYVNHLFCGGLRHLTICTELRRSKVTSELGFQADQICRSVLLQWRQLALKSSTEALVNPSFQGSASCCCHPLPAQSLSVTLSPTNFLSLSLSALWKQCPSNPCAPSPSSGCQPTALSVACHLLHPLSPRRQLPTIPLCLSPALQQNRRLSHRSLHP